MALLSHFVYSFSLWNLQPYSKNKRPYSLDKPNPNVSKSNYLKFIFTGLYKSYRITILTRYVVFNLKECEKVMFRIYVSLIFLENAFAYNTIFSDLISVMRKKLERTIQKLFNSTDIGAM